jgi:hypothetical protein
MCIAPALHTFWGVPIIEVTRCGLASHGGDMVINHHIIRAHADQRVASLRSEATPRPRRTASGTTRSSRSRWRRAYRAHILGLRGAAR